MDLKKKKRNDFLLLGCLLIVSLTLLIFQFTSISKGDFLVVTQDGKDIGRFFLTEEKEIPILNENGEFNLLIIQENEAYIKEANCPDGLCIKQHPISRQGESLICLPHRLVVTIESLQKSDVDGVAY